MKTYFVPVECDPHYVELSGYPTDVFYENLAKIPTKSVTVVLDACFSGAGLFENISPIAIKVKERAPIEKMTILSSSSGDQVSSWYNAKQHGLFTWFFLKAIHSKNADSNHDNSLTWKEIVDYFSDNAYGVPYHARRLHNVEQVPVLMGAERAEVLVEFK